MQLMYFLYPDIENSFHIRITNPVHSGSGTPKFRLKRVTRNKSRTVHCKGAFCFVYEKL
jgi:hypothetical protein